METKLNIVEILKDKPKGTKLYSPLFGDVYFSDINNSTTYVLHHTSMASFYSDATFIKFEEAEPLLFPSNEMRDWSKFAWKKGDILISSNGTIEVIFNGFDDATYASFEGKYALKTVDGESKYIGDSDDDYGVFYTGNYLKESEAPAQTYIKTIEKKLGGKLNLETLEIEKQLEFKDGDIIVTDAVPDEYYSKCIFILKGDLNTDECHANSYVFYNINNNHISFNITDRNTRVRNIHLATDSEKQQLFSVLANEDKAWDAEKKQIVDLKPKCELKPFDKVLVREDEYSEWQADFFSNMDEDNRFVCIGSTWDFCIPYNDKTAKLIGTTNTIEED